MSNSLNDISRFVSKKDSGLLHMFLGQELNRENSDYYMGEYNSGPFTGYPTRVYYGLSIQWDDLADWEKKTVKSHAKTNKTKFKFLIKKDNQHLLEPLSVRMGTSLVKLINCLKKIVNVDNNENINEDEKYVLRAFYLYKYIHETSKNITKNVSGYSFLKKSIKNGEIIEKDGTFLSIIYDIYNEAVNPIEKRIKKPKKEKPPFNITSNKNFPPLQSKSKKENKQTKKYIQFGNFDLINITNNLKKYK